MRTGSDQQLLLWLVFKTKFGYRVTRVEVIQSDENLATANTVNPKYSRASDGLWKKQTNFMAFLGQTHGKIGQFRGNFRGKLRRVAISKNCQFCGYFQGKFR